MVDENGQLKEEDEGLSMRNLNIDNALKMM